MVALGPGTSGGPNDAICVYNALGVINVVIDANGWYGSSTATGGYQFQALPPTRICDTRVSTTSCLPAGAIGANVSHKIPVAGDQDIPAFASTTMVVAVIANLTAIAPTAKTVLIVYPRTFRTLRRRRISTSKRGRAAQPGGRPGRYVGRGPVRRRDLPLQQCRQRQRRHRHRRLVPVDEAHVRRDSGRSTDHVVIGTGRVAEPLVLYNCARTVNAMIDFEVWFSSCGMDERTPRDGRGAHAMASRPLTERLGAIDGVMVKSSRSGRISRGYFIEQLKRGDLDDQGRAFMPDHPFAQMSRSLAYARGGNPPELIKAFHWHKRQWDYWDIVQGEARVVLVDLRHDSPTVGRVQSVMLGENAPTHGGHPAAGGAWISVPVPA